VVAAHHYRWQKLKPDVNLMDMIMSNNPGMTRPAVFRPDCFSMQIDPPREFRSRKLRSMETNRTCTDSSGEMSG
jgi:hypothetical protein